MKKYKVTIKYAVEFHAASVDDAIAKVADMNLPATYVEDTFEVVSVHDAKAQARQG